VALAQAEADASEAAEAAAAAAGSIAAPDDSRGGRRLLGIERVFSSGTDMVKKDARARRTEALSFLYKVLVLIRYTAR